MTRIGHPITQGFEHARGFGAGLHLVRCVNMQPLTYHLNIDDMTTRDGVPLDFNATIRLRVVDAVKVV